MFLCIRNSTITVGDNLMLATTDYILTYIFIPSQVMQVNPFETDFVIFFDTAEY